ncbi:hypothetical protein ACH5RR_024886 [Cinchona calisaya]|uniref:Pentatricopeptide repeat-containing protein n=1 Tax=Cinchona calisaya TaxID=153742 RepID=A0ABD2Z0M4_9GENT
MRMRFKLTIRHFTSLLYGWCKEGKLMEAKVVLVKMREAGFEPDIVVYDNLLNGYSVAGKMALCTREKMEDAMRVLRDMERNGCEADVVIYTTLISGFCKWEQISLSWLKVYGVASLLKDVSFTHARTIRNHALFSKGHVKEACSYCLDMMDAGLMPQPDTFAKLMCCLRKLYNRQLAAEITEKVEET